MFHFIRPQVLAVTVMSAALALGCSNEAEGDADTSAPELNASGNVTIKSESHSIESTYRSTGGLSGRAAHYHMVASRSLVSSTTTGTGILASLNKQTHDEPDTKVPGVGDVGGHADFTISEVPGKPGIATVALDQLVEVRQDEFVARVEFKYTAVAAFVTGSFSDFATGKTVKLRFTDAGQEAISQAKRRAFEQSMANVSAQLVTQLRSQVGPGAAATPIVVDEFKGTGHTELSGNLTELKSANPEPDAGFSVKMHFGVSLDL